MAKTALTKINDVRPQEARDLSYQMLGAAKYATALHKQTGSDLIRFLILVRDEKRYLDYDCQTFDEFLSSGHSPIRQRNFYNQLELFKKEGDSYDLLEDWRIPARWRKQLNAGDIRMDGDRVEIGDQELSFASGEISSTIARQLIERLIQERIADKKAIAKHEDWKSKYQQLKRENEEALEVPSYVVALKQALDGLRTLIAETSDLTGEMKAERGEHDLPEVCLLIGQLARTYGEPDPLRPDWNFDRPNWREQENLPYFQSDAIDGDNF